DAALRPGDFPQEMLLRAVPGRRQLRSRGRKTAEGQSRDRERPFPNHHRFAPWMPPVSRRGASSSRYFCCSSAGVESAWPGGASDLRCRPRGSRNPKRRVPDLVARPLSPQALSALLARKPHLLRPLAAQLLPPPLASIDPAERLGIDLSSLSTVEDFRQVLVT